MRTGSAQSGSRISSFWSFTWLSRVCRGSEVFYPFLIQSFSFCLISFKMFDILHHCLDRDGDETQDSLLELLLKPCCTLHIAAKHRQQVPLWLSSRASSTILLESSCLLDNKDTTASSTTTTLQVPSILLKFIALSKLLSTFPQLSRYRFFFLSFYNFLIAWSNLS